LVLSAAASNQGRPLLLNAGDFIPAKKGRLVMKRFALTVMVVAVLFLAGCSGKSSAPQAAGGPAPQGRPAEVSGDVLAVVGEHSITQANFNTEVEKLPAQHRQWTTTPQGKKYILESMIEGFLIDDEAKRRTLDKRIDIAAKLDSYRRQLLKEALLEEALKGEQQQVADEDAQKYFNEHPAEFKQPQKVKVFDMVFKDEASAKAAIASLNKGADFAALAREQSVDSFTKDRGGDIPEFFKEMRPDLFAVAVAAKRPGQILGPVKTGSGYHVMKFVKIIPPEEKKFDQVKDSLKARLQAMKRQESYMGFVKGLREGAKVKVNEEFLAPPKPVDAPKSVAPAAPAAAPTPPRGK
jgi:hypothetical protein